MIETRRDKQDKIYAYCEWNLVNEEGHFKKDGEYVYVNDLYIHPDYRRNGILRDFINTIAEKSGAKYCYFTRKKYNERLSIYRKFNIYTRRKICGVYGKH